MEPLPFHGSTSQFFRVAPGEIVKAPAKVWEGCPTREDLEESNRKAIDIERQILEQLGHHRRIIPYLGVHPAGILLSEAEGGDLQTYIDTHHAHLSLAQRWDICEQAAEAIVHLHSKGVIHSDLRLDNILVHNESRELWLCDFGGSMCAELDLDGGHLPDIPFSDPRMKWESTPATDIFSLGSIFYVICKGHWPFLTGPPDWKSTEDRMAYWDTVEGLFRKGEFPAVDGLTGGEVIKSCWDLKFNTAEEVLHAVQKARVA